MAKLQDILAVIPEELSTLRATFQVMHNFFPDELDEFNIPRVQGFVDEIQTGVNSFTDQQLERDEDQVRDDLFKFSIGANAIQQALGVDRDTADALILGANEGGVNFSDLDLSNVGGGRTDADPGTLPGLLAGGRTIKVPSETGSRWYQVYEFPPGSGQFMSFQFNDKAQVVAALGEDFDFQTHSQNWFDNNVLSEAAAEEVIGLEGSFQSFTDDLMREAALAAGVNDPGLAGRIASNPEMQQIMAQAIKGEWSAEQILAAQRQTDFWKNELYPGIERFYGSTTDPERAWKNYVDQLSPALRQLGYEPDANGTFNAQIAEMLSLNIDAQTFLSQVPIFIQATQNEDFAAILNAWAERDLGRSIEFDDWFDLIAGESIPELDQVAENARLTFIAQQQGTDITDLEIAELAQQTQLSDAAARAAFSEVNQAMLALGPSGLERGGLTRDEILSAAAGVAPESGRSVDEVRLAVAKLARENDLFDENKINFYVGFDPLGRPNRPGLVSLAPEGA